MIVHEMDSIKTKSKIILSPKPSTKLQPKKKKNTTNSNKIEKFTTYVYNKIKLNTILASLKNQYNSTNLYKVHSTLVETLNKV